MCVGIHGLGNIGYSGKEIWDYESHRNIRVKGKAYRCQTKKGIESWGLISVHGDGSKMTESCRKMMPSMGDLGGLQGMSQQGLEVLWNVTMFMASTGVFISCLPHSRYGYEWKITQGDLITHWIRVIPLSWRAGATSGMV